MSELGFKGQVCLMGGVLLQAFLLDLLVSAAQDEVLKRFFNQKVSKIANKIQQKHGQLGTASLPQVGRFRFVWNVTLALSGGRSF